mmetsp:Transcript_1931/g.3343  ORF Transcript_1931/g.3343 Transcript_1931/m.3343 type:complete len:93 (+) Transcript_1931:87-365(+)
MLLLLSPWSVNSLQLAQLVKSMRDEINMREGKNYYQIFLVPVDIYENDDEGYLRIAEILDAFPLPCSDKILLEQIYKEFEVHSCPQLIVLNE